MTGRMPLLVPTGSLLLWLCAAAYAATTPPSVALQDHFDGLYRAFQDVAADRAVVLVEISPATRLFSAALRERPSFTTLMRTNAKGVLINEVVRDKGAVRAYRSVADQRWYRTVRTSLQPYYGAVRDRHGREFLLWARPVVIVSGSGARRFGGAVAVKVDLLAALQQVAETSEYPFRVLADTRPVFAHRWEAEMDYDEAAVEIHGLENVLVYEVRSSPERAPEQVSDFGDAPEDRTVVVTDSAGAATPVSERAAPHRIPAGRIVLLLLAIGIAAAFVRSRLRHRHILRQVLRETGPA